MRKAILILSSILCQGLLAGCFESQFEPLLPLQGRDYSLEIIGSPPEDGWYWVRGRIPFALSEKDREPGAVQEGEALLVTLQKGSRERPEPTEQAWLYICRRDPITSFRTLLKRYLVFSTSPAEADLPVPEQVLASCAGLAMNQGRLSLLDLDDNGRHEILVTLWRETSPDIATVYRIYDEPERGFAPIFGCQVRQRRSVNLQHQDVNCPIRKRESDTFQHRDLDNDGIEEIVIPSAIDLPPRTEGPAAPRPSWISIFQRDERGFYRQADSAFPQAYYDTLRYLLEDMALCPAGLQSKHAFYLGLIYKFRTSEEKECREKVQIEMARVFLGRAAASPEAEGALARELLRELQGPAAAPEETDGGER
ncbi:MAG: hypothetical protein V1918_10980 [Planctomycetota bacterium]